MNKAIKNDIINQKIKKYKSIFKNIEKDKKSFAEKLYCQAAFMEATLKELQEQVNLEGAVIETTNGNGFVTTQEHPAQKSYNAMIKNFNSVIKTLVEMLPEQKEESDELIEYLSRDVK